MVSAPYYMGAHVDAVWPHLASVRDAVGDLESLSVAEHARGRGIGTRLMDAARELLRSRGVGYWSVTVAAGNADSIRLYDREGFRPRYQHLLARL